MSKDYDSPSNSFTIEKYDVVSGQYKENKKGINIGGFQRPENPTGKLYQLSNNGGSWEGKDLEIIKANPKAKQKKTDRPSPSESATIFPVGTKMVGNDGDNWEVKANKSGVHRWVKIGGQEKKQDEGDFNPDDLEVLEDETPKPDVVVLDNNQGSYAGKGGKLQIERDSPAFDGIEAEITIGFGIPEFKETNIYVEEGSYVKVGDLVKFWESEDKKNRNLVSMGVIEKMDYLDAEANCFVSIKNSYNRTLFEIEATLIKSIDKKNKAEECKSLTFLKEVGVFSKEGREGDANESVNFQFILPVNVRESISHLLSITSENDSNFVFQTGEFNDNIREFDEKLLKFLMLYLRNNTKYFEPLGYKKYFYDNLINYLEDMSSVGVPPYGFGKSLSIIRPNPTIRKYTITQISNNNDAIDQNQKSYLVADLDYRKVAEFKVIGNRIEGVMKDGFIHCYILLSYIINDIKRIESTFLYEEMSFNETETEIWFKKMNSFSEILSK